MGTITVGGWLAAQQRAPRGHSRRRSRQGPDRARSGATPSSSTSLDAGVLARYIGTYGTMQPTGMPVPQPRGGSTSSREEARSAPVHHTEPEAASTAETERSEFGFEEEEAPPVPEASAPLTDSRVVETSAPAASASSQASSSSATLAPAVITNSASAAEPLHGTAPGGSGAVGAVGGSPGDQGLGTIDLWSCALRPG